MATITERCACGATFTTTTSLSSMADYSASQWRESHKHAESVGICAHRPQLPDGLPPDLPTPVCMLKAGHTGAHSDGDGAHWTEETPDE